MTRFLLTIVCMAGLAGCSSDVREMKISEIEQLGPEQRREFADELSEDDRRAFFEGTAAYSNDSAGLRTKTVGEIIEEGKRRQQKSGE